MRGADAAEQAPAASDVGLGLRIDVARFDDIALIAAQPALRTEHRRRLQCEILKPTAVFVEPFDVDAQRQSHRIERKLRSCIDAAVGSIEVDDASGMIRSSLHRDRNRLKLGNAAAPCPRSRLVSPALRKITRELRAELLLLGRLARPELQCLRRRLARIVLPLRACKSERIFGFRNVERV